MGTRTLLLFNESATAERTYLQVTANLGGAAIRYEQYQGRRYMAVPMVMLVEGVHNGSQGPLYYPPAELAKTPEVWNHKPVVINHPSIDGRPISACSPDVLEQHGVGLVFHAAADGNARLTAEAWLDVLHLEERAPDVAKRLKAREVIEVSTGLFSDMEQSEGVWNGEEYAAVARNYRPDHLAILPDSVGACSVADGAGLLRNELSYGEAANRLHGLLYERFGDSAYVLDVFADRVVYEREGRLYQQTYSVNDSVVSLEGEPAEVQRVVTYQTLNGELVGNATTKPPKETVMDKAKLVESLIGNANTHWSESHREWLMTADEETLTKLVPPPAEPAANADPAPATPGEPKPSQPLTMDEYLRAAPAEFQSVFANMARSYRKERAGYVETLLALGERCPYTREQLEGKDLADLEALAKLAGPTGNDAGGHEAALARFLGATEVATANTQPAAHEPLGLPTVTWD